MTDPSSIAPPVIADDLSREQGAAIETEPGTTTPPELPFDFTPPISPIRTRLVTEWEESLSANLLQSSVREASTELSAAQNLTEYLDYLKEKEEDFAGHEVKESGEVREPSNQRRSRSWLKRIIDVGMAKLATLALLLWMIGSLLQCVILSPKSLATRRAALPSPFFPNASLAQLTDLYTGNGADKHLLLAHSELTIVMLYAPWSLHCMEARRVFSDVAAAFNGRELAPQGHANATAGLIRFVAVNCFDQRGECRRRYKLFSYPVVFAYVPMQEAIGVPIVFNQPLTTDRLATWAMHLLRPVRRIAGMMELDEVMEIYEHVILGYLPANRDGGKKPGTHQFRVFLASAYKAAASSNTIAFIHFQTASLAEELGFTAESQLRFYCNYCSGRRSRLDSIDTFQLAPKRDSGSPKSQQIIEWIQSAVDLWERERADQLNLEEEEAGGKSETLFKQINGSTLTIALFTMDFGLSLVSRAYGKMKELARTLNDCNSTLTDSFDPSQAPSLVDYLEQARAACVKLASSNTSFGSHLGPPLAQWPSRLHCQYYRLLRKSQPSVLKAAQSGAMEPDKEAKAESSALARLAGHSCRSNISVGFVVLDERFTRYYQRKWLGGDATERDAFLLIAQPQEKIYKLKEVGDGPATMLLDYLERRLEARSKEGGGEEGEIKGNEQVSLLTRLNSSSFVNTILHRANHFDSVIYFTAGRHSLASHAPAFSIHTAQDYFSQFNHNEDRGKEQGQLIRFFMLDVGENSLPYPYDFPLLPTLGFFPAFHPNASSIFPSEGLALTLPNLMAFLTARVQPKLRWRMAHQLCVGRCRERNLARMAQFVEEKRAEIVELRRQIRRRKPSTPNHPLKAVMRRRLMERRVVMRLKTAMETMREGDGYLDEVVEKSLLLQWLLIDSRRKRHREHK